MAASEIPCYAFPNNQGPLLSYNCPFQETCRRYIDEMFKASRIFIICSGSLAKNTSHLEDLQNALFGKLAAVRIGMKPHTLMSEVMEIIRLARSVDADMIVTLGGGSLIDAAKAVAFVSHPQTLMSLDRYLTAYQALGNDAHTESDLMALPQTSNPDVPAKPPKCPIICVPTTLSGGEFTPYAGITREIDLKKFVLCNPLNKGPELIILDANLALTTPLNIWIQTGVRAIDHCVESFCSLQRVAGVDEACVKGLQRLIPALLLCKADPSNAKARQDCQPGIPLALTPLQKGVYPGAGHGIGHQLGPLGVGHGEDELHPPACCVQMERETECQRREAGIDPGGIVEDRCREREV